MQRRLVVLDEAHAAHVGGEVVDDVCAAQRGLAVLLLLQIEAEVLRLGEALIPLVKRFDVDGADVRDPCRTRSATRWPPMNPPAPHTTMSIVRIRIHVLSRIWETGWLRWCGPRAPGCSSDETRLGPRPALSRSRRTRCAGSRRSRRDSTYSRAAGEPAHTESCDAAHAPGGRQVPPPGRLERERTQLPGIRQPFGAELLAHGRRQQRPAAPRARPRSSPRSCARALKTLARRPLSPESNAHATRPVPGTCTVLATSPARRLQLKSPIDPHVD